MPEPTNYVFVSWIYINDLNLSNFRQDKDLDYVKLIKPHTLQLEERRVKNVPSINSFKSINFAVSIIICQLCKSVSWSYPDQNIPHFQIKVWINYSNIIPAPQLSNCSISKQKLENLSSFCKSPDCCWSMVECDFSTEPQFPPVIISNSSYCRSK